MKCAYKVRRQINNTTAAAEAG